MDGSFTEGREAVTQGTLRDAKGRALPLTRTNVRARVTGPVATVVVEQTFRNDGDEAIEAVYLFPLPREASVYRMEFRIADRVVKGVVKEKAEARAAYQRARAEGRAATLLEEDTPALFTLSVANVAPGATIDVTLEYQEVVPYDDGEWRFVFPMVAPERYREGPPPPASAALPPPRVPTGERGADVTLSVELQGEPDGLRCASHRTVTERSPEGVTVRLDGASVANRDFSLAWRAGDAGVRPDLRFERAEGEAGTFLLTITPSNAPDLTERRGDPGGMKALRCGNCGGTVTDLASIKEIHGLGPVVPCSFCGAILTPGTEVVTRATRPRDVLILVDRSASMRGAMLQARKAVGAILKGLTAADAVQVAAFDHDRAFFDNDGARFVALSPEVIAKVDGFLSKLAPRGGTELEQALGHSAKLPKRDDRTRVTVLITDAGVGNDGRLLRRLPELLGSATRLFVLGLGPAVDRGLIDRLAHAGGGACDVVMNREDAGEALERFARRVREGGPVLTGLSLHWEGAGVSELHPAALPDLYGGQVVRALGRFTGEGATKLVITGATADGRGFRQELTVTLPARSDDTPGLGRLWARREVASIAELAAAGGAQASALKAEGTALSLRYGIVGAFTSLVAEDSAVSVEKVRRQKGVLYFERGSWVGRGPVTLARESVTLGRQTGCDVVVDDGKVSRMHLTLRVDDDGWSLKDIDSVNGTAVDGRVVREARLAHGARITVGETTLRFELAGGPDAFFEVVPTTRVEVPLATPDDVDEEPASDGAAVERARAAAPSKKGRAAEGASAPLRSAAFFEDDESFGDEPSLGRGGFGGVPVGGAPMASGYASEPFGAVPSPAPARPAMPGAFSAPGGAPPSRGGGGPLGAAPPRPTGAPMPPPAMPAMPAMPSPMAPPAMGAPPSPLGPPPPITPPSAMPAPVSPMPFGPPSPVPCLSVAPFSPTYGAEAYAPPSETVTCPRCAHLNPARTRYCLSCGADVTAPVLRPPQMEHERAVPQSPIEAPGSDPYPEHELRWIAARGRGALDLVFLVDATGSMGAYIHEVKTHLLALIDALKGSPLCRSLRLGLVAYRDHPPQDNTYASHAVALTDDVAAVRREVDALQASGGGDGPESVTDGLFDVVRLDWRPDAAKAVVWFGDAPPHGVEPRGDAFPEGCPCGQHWFAQAESCREMGVAVYAIGCLPGLRGFAGAEAVFRQVARTTRGMFLPLREATMLVPLIAGAAVSELDRQRVDERVADLVDQWSAPLAATDEAERVRWITDALRREGVRARGMAFDEDSPRPAPQRFRDVTEADVAGALDRLRMAGRAAV
ncbi:MAG: VIT domain-containing protein [Polyangiales bacterium]